MTIQSIKERLPIETLFVRYGLKPDRNNRLHCPFHPDKKPSMQYYPDTGTVYCFSTNCPRSGKPMDVIDLVMYLDGCTKHQAILTCEAMIRGEAPGTAPVAVTRPEPTGPKQPGAAKQVKREEISEVERIRVLTALFTSFRHGLERSQEAKAYLKKRHLLAAFQEGRLEVGYNSGQFHHREGKGHIESALKLGLLKERRAGRPQAGYQVWAKDCVLFPLKNQKADIVGLYARSLTNDNDQRHFYLKNRQGLFPGYPPPETRKVILSESVIDAASLPALPQTYALALYGTNGLTSEHVQALEALKDLDEIIFFLDGDEAGEKAVKTYGDRLSLLPWVSERKINLSKVNLLVSFPGQDANSLLDSQPPQVYISLLNRRTDLSVNPRQVAPPRPKAQEQTEKPALDTSNPRFWIFERETARYSLAGGLKPEADKMRVSLHIQASAPGSPKYRKQLDLYEGPQVAKLAREASEKLSLELEKIEQDLAALTEALEAYREEQAQQRAAKEKKEAGQVIVPARTVEKAVAFWKQADLMQHLNALIGRAGVVGEKKNRLFLYGIATSYKMEDPLHALVQGSSGSGKTHLIHAIAKLMPSEDVIPLTRVTESSLYNYPRYYLSNKLIVLEDFDGMKEEAQFAWRELQSKGEVSSSTTAKDEQGNLCSEVRIVSGPIASMVATTHGEVYEDNMGRCFLLAIDESREQTERVIAYQNARVAGSIDKEEQEKVKTFLQHSVRLLKPLPVVNPYAGQVHLPREAHKIRRLNDLYQSYVKQITWLHQYRRSKDNRGRLLTTQEDLRIAFAIMFEGIVLKVDELDGELRRFYEDLKAHVRKQAGNSFKSYSFTRKEIRQALRISKTQQHRYFSQLLQLEYLYASGGTSYGGYTYKIGVWDDQEGLRKYLSSYLEGQLGQLD